MRIKISSCRGAAATLFSLLALSATSAVLPGAFAQNHVTDAPVPSVETGGRPAADQLRRDGWRQDMMKSRQKEAGCFQATYPERKWQRVPCDAMPDDARPHGLPEKFSRAERENLPRPLDSGVTSGDYFAASKGSIRSATGTLPAITNVTSVLGFGLENEFSLQLNSNFFSAPVCNGAAGCFVWEQFVYDSGASIIIEPWLVNFLNKPTNKCPDGWKTSGNSCFAYAGYKQLPVRKFSDLVGVSIIAEAGKNGLDTLTLSIPGPGVLLAITPASSVFTLAGNWKTAEFNVFGESGGVQATFNPGAQRPRQRISAWDPAQRPRNLPESNLLNRRRLRRRRQISNFASNVRTVAGVAPKRTANLSANAFAPAQRACASDSAGRKHVMRPYAPRSCIPAFAGTTDRKSANTRLTRPLGQPR
jgi:hypothetical protein